MLVRARPMKESHSDIVLDLLSLDSLEILASASMDHTIRLWDMHTGKERKTLIGHTKGVRSLAYSPEYRFLVSAGFDYDALVWNPYVEKLILPLHGHNRLVPTVCCAVRAVHLCRVTGAMHPSLPSQFPGRGEDCPRDTTNHHCRHRGHLQALGHPQLWLRSNIHVG